MAPWLPVSRFFFQVARHVHPGPFHLRALALLLRASTAPPLLPALTPALLSLPLFTSGSHSEPWLQRPPGESRSSSAPSAGFPPVTHETWGAPTPHHTTASQPTPSKPSRSRRASADSQWGTQPQGFRHHDYSLYSLALVHQPSDFQTDLPNCLLTISTKPCSRHLRLTTAERDAWPLAAPLPAPHAGHSSTLRPVLQLKPWALFLVLAPPYSKQLTRPLV